MAEIRVRVDTEVEAYPELAIYEVGSSDGGWLIPAELLGAVNDAYAALDVAETALMRYIADRYPRAGAVHEWLKDRTVVPPV
jgi:hypothetical protein